MKLRRQPNTLVVMTKSPVPGTVKTRLCPPLTPETAAELHEAFAKDILHAVSEIPGVDTVVSYTPCDARGFFEELFTGASEYIEQVEGDIGKRMSACIETLCERSEAVVVIGTDSPTLPTDFVEEAFRVLLSGEAEVVFGPSDDGGYYLIGMRTPHPDLFRDIIWSSPEVLESSLTRCEEVGLSYSLLQRWYDIDTYEDLIRMSKELDENRSPETARVMHSMTFISSAWKRTDRCVSIPFEERLSQGGLWPVRAERPTVLQMNLGFLCNQKCVHCHHDAGPERTELMSAEVIESSLEFAQSAGIHDFDLTGGAPELNPRFRKLVEAITSDGSRVTDRCNLTILSEPGQEGLSEFLAANGVKIAASLPCYTSEVTDSVRGDSVFERSIQGLLALNVVGYGIPGTGLDLTLVHNPSDPSLPGDQAALEDDYRQQLSDLYGVVFTDLITITNVPSGRLLASLEAGGVMRSYMRELECSFNPQAVSRLMCRNTISVRWDGLIFDCDFNQSLRWAIGNGKPVTIRDATLEKLTGRAVKCGDHCYACTAGHGSSCTGALT